MIFSDYSCVCTCHCECPVTKEGTVCDECQEGICIDENGDEYNSESNKKQS